MTLYCFAIQVDVIVGLESRGFVFGPMIAQKLNVSFVPVRKAGKLPGETTKVTYSLEYGQVRRHLDFFSFFLKVKSKETKGTLY